VPLLQEKFINDRAVLIAAAEKAGLKGAAEYLADPESGLAAVKASIASKARGVSGVPHFTIGNMIQLSGTGRVDGDTGRVGGDTGRVEGLT